MGTAAQPPGPINVHDYRDNLSAAIDALAPLTGNADKP